MGNLVKRFCGFLVCLLGVLMTVGLYSSSALATDIYSGYIGELALTWELADGILTIGGSGEAPIFASPDDQPWAEVRDQIIEVRYTAPGDLRIADMQYWFMDCVSLQRVEIPYTAQVIGTDAFANCPSLTEILFYYYDEDNFEIVDGAFYVDATIDTKIYLVSEQMVATKKLHSSLWEEANRAVEYYDVYTCEIYCAEFGYGYLPDLTDPASGHYRTYGCACGAWEDESLSGFFAHSDANSDGKCDDCFYQMGVTITWNVDGTIISTIFQTSGAILTLPTSPTKAGYTFNGWYTAPSGGVQVTASTPVPSSAVSYYAQWTPVTTTLWINPMGGFWNGSDAVVNFPNTYGSTMHIPVPTAVGHTFTGWSFASLVGSEWTGAPVGAMTSLTGDSIYTYAGTIDGAQDALFANWSIHTSSLYINPNGGSWSGYTSGEAFEHPYGTVCPIVSPIRVGYTFSHWVSGGWNGSEWVPTMWGTLSSTTGEPTYTYGPTDGVLDGITAEWVPNTYSVLWDVDGVSFDITSQVYDTNIILPIVEPIKEYHHFDGWWTDPVGGVRVTEDMLYQTASDVTYYAHFIQVFSVTVPLSVPVLVSETGEVYVPELCVVNDSTGRVAIVDVLVESLNGWTLVPYSTRMEYEKVNSNLVGVRLNEWVSSVFGVYEEFFPNWVIAENSFFILEPDFVISPMKYGCSDLVILRMVFTVRWS